MRISDWSSDVCSSDLLIEQWDDVAGEVRAIGDRDHALADVRRHAPIPRPGKIYALGLNYRQHVAEMGRELPAHQTWFTKPGTAVNGPYDPVQRPKVSEQLDYEVELVVVIRSEEHTSELQSLMRISYAVFCLTKKKT